MLRKLRSLYPEIMADLPNLRFIEQHDPKDTKILSQPHAFVCDVVHEVELSADIGAITNKGIPENQWAAMADLRDKLHEGAELGWSVVVCGDEERAVDDDEDESDDDEDDEYVEGPSARPQARPPPRSAPGSSMGRFGATSPKITQSTLPMRHEIPRTISSSAAVHRPITPSNNRPTVSSEMRSPSSRAGPSTPSLSRTPTTDSPGRGKERESEVRRVRFQPDTHTIYPNTETGVQQRSSSIGKGLRKVFGLKESRRSVHYSVVVRNVVKLMLESKSNLKKDNQKDEDRNSPPPIPRKSRK